MSKKIFVGGLPFETTEDELRNLFQPHGDLESCRIVTDKFTGKSRGFGFVEMDDEAADKAIAELNETELGGRTLTVNEARPPQPRGGGGGGGYRGGGGGGGRW